MNELFNYQTKVIDRLVNTDVKGLIVYHSMGSGKTKIALTALSLFSGKKLIVCPASVINNFYSESKKHSINIDDQTEIISYQKLLIEFEKLKTVKFSIVIFDEAHRLRNKNTKAYQLSVQIIKNSKKVLLLTGTAEYNQPNDIAVLINLLDKNSGVPDTLSGFCRKFIGKDDNIINQNKLSDTLNKYVDFYIADNSSKLYPYVSNILYRTEMSKKQILVYKFLEKKLPFRLRYIVKKNLPVSLPEAALINLYSNAIRQASLSICKFDKTAIPEDSPKLMCAVQNLLKKINIQNFRAIIYSNYIECGLMQYKKILESYNVSTLIFTGKTSLSCRKKIINEYNSQDSNPKILLLSSSGGEGLDLKGTRLIQILEPHFNIEKINQIKSRGIRLNSHSHLPINEQNVLIEEYHSIFPLSFFNKLFKTKQRTSIDEYLYFASLKKKAIIEKIINLCNK